MPEAERAERGTLLSIFAISFAVLALSNFLKPLQLMGQESGFVLLGMRLTGTANLIAGPLAGAYLLAYAYGIWKMKRFVVGMAHAYALYVILNLLLWTYRESPPDAWHALGLAGYAAMAVGVSLGAAIVLTKRKRELT